MDLLLSCVSENDPAWFLRVQNLVLSLRTFGGSISKAPFVANFVGDVAPEFRDALGELDAEVRVVERFDSKSFGFTNKFRVLELDEEREFDVLVYVDHDVVVVDDISGHTPASSIGVKPVDYDLFTDGEWRRLYKALDLRPPAKTLRATSSGKAIRPYFNAGVLTVPRHLCGEFRRRWATCHTELLALLKGEPDSIRPGLSVYTEEQAALAMAITGGRIPWTALPVAMNFPCHVPVHRSALAASPSPALLHYHDRIDSEGFLMRPRCEVAADPAHRFNIVRAQHLSLPYSGLRSPPAWASFRRSLRSRVGRTLARRHRIRAGIRDLTG